MILHLKRPALVAVLFWLAACSSGHGQELLTPQAFAERLTKTPTPQLLDVRTPGEYAGGHLTGAVNADINSDAFRQAAAGLDKSKPVYVYCLAGSRSADAASLLKGQGFAQVYNLKGGVMAWQNAGLPLTLDPAQAPRQTARIWTKAELDKEVSQGQALIDFHATWCKPCRQMEPILARLQSEEKINVIRVDVDANRDLAAQYSVSEIPVMLAFKAGKQIMRLEGYTPFETIKGVYR